MSMQHINQRYDSDCGVAAVAMVADLPYERVAEVVEVNEGLHCHDVTRLLHYCTARPWLASKRGYGRPLYEVRLPHINSVLLIRREDQSLGHYVAWDAHERRIYDPELKRPYEQQSYPRSRWPLIRVFVLQPYA